MKKTVILSAMFALGLFLSPHVAFAQATDQTTTAPMATATVNPGPTDQTMGGATAAPGVNAYPQTTGNSNTGWWGLVGLIGLLGLFGGRSRRTTTTISGPP